VTTTPEEREALIAALSTAHRSRDGRGKIAPHPAFHDLDEAGRLEAFDVALATRALEAATDEDSLSTTARVVLAKIRQSP